MRAERVLNTDRIRAEYKPNASRKTGCVLIRCYKYKPNTCRARTEHRPNTCRARAGYDPKNRMRAEQVTNRASRLNCARPLGEWRRPESSVFPPAPRPHLSCGLWVCSGLSSVPDGDRLLLAAWVRIPGHRPEYQALFRRRSWNQQQTHFSWWECGWTGGQNNEVALSLRIDFIAAWRFYFVPCPPVHRLWCHIWKGSIQPLGY